MRAKVPIKEAWVNLSFSLLSSCTSFLPLTPILLHALIEPFLFCLYNADSLNSLSSSREFLSGRQKKPGLQFHG
jgi:hypothetical protein